jgi:hypothetical protein
VDTAASWVGDLCKCVCADCYWGRQASVWERGICDVRPNGLCLCLGLDLIESKSRRPLAALGNRSTPVPRRLMHAALCCLGCRAKHISKRPHKKRLGLLGYLSVADVEARSRGKVGPARLTSAARCDERSRNLIRLARPRSDIIPGASVCDSSAHTHAPHTDTHTHRHRQE